MIGWLRARQRARRDRYDEQFLRPALEQRAREMGHTDEALIKSVVDEAMGIHKKLEGR